MQAPGAGICEKLCYRYTIPSGDLNARMTFFSVLLALILEQMRALSTQNPIYNLIRSHATHTSQSFDAGLPRHGVLAWLVVVLPFVLAVGVIYYLLMRVNIFLGFAWNVLVVYLTMGFRQFSHYFTDIHVALNNDNVNEAREILHQWIGIDTVDMPVDEIVRHTLLHAVIASHRHVFGVFFWFLMPVGPAGAVLYRLAEYLSRRWTEPAPDRSPAFGAFARKVFYVIDWVPARLTAIGFAIVGNFEDAIYAWRHYAKQWPNENEGILLAAGSGALGARLTGPLAEVSSVDALNQGDDAVLPVGSECTPRTLQAAVGLVWRAVLLWMLLLLLLTLAVWLG
ncbi:Cobalamin biosynthesis protein CbiB [Pandoraea cepalis]|uniref:Cobalamin biosynthesis protein CobD n=2 Tax=Burkholderiaceae TaxID=119060 RepID=A0A5E4V5P2_9BURK|nr:Cobalamin biosynthesis protein CbiB [Pandoraea cepalis]